MIYVRPTMLDQILCGLELASTSSVIQWSLTIMIDGVSVSMELLNQPFDHFQVTLSSRIKKRGLSVGVLVIHIATKPHQ